MIHNFFNNINLIVFNNITFIPLLVFKLKYILLIKRFTQVNCFTLINLSLNGA